MTNLNMTIISSGWRLCLEYPSSFNVFCTEVKVSVGRGYRVLSLEHHVFVS